MLVKLVFFRVPDSRHLSLQCIHRLKKSIGAQFPCFPLGIIVEDFSVDPSTTSSKDYTRVLEYQHRIFGHDVIALLRRERMPSQEEAVPARLRRSAPSIPSTHRRFVSPSLSAKISTYSNVARTISYVRCSCLFPPKRQQHQSGVQLQHEKYGGCVALLRDFPSSEVLQTQT